MIIIAKFSCNGTIIGKVWRAVRDAREVQRKSDCLVRVDIGRSDGCHESNPSRQTITKVPNICRIKAVFMMGIDKRVKETQNHNTMLKTPQEYTGDQVV